MIEASDHEGMPLTNADTSRTIGAMIDIMSVLVSENMLILLDFFGATRRIRTDDLLITNSPKPANQAKSNQKFPKSSGNFAFLLWVDLVCSAASSRTTRGQILDGKLPSGLSVLEERLYGCESLRRSASRMG
jgi:hypothetical protein